MKAHNNEVQAYTRVALTLFSLCILVLCAIWFLNRTLYENDVSYEMMESWQFKTREMLQRIRAFNAKNDELFRYLTWAAFHNKFTYTDKGPEAVLESGEIPAFSKKAARIIASSPDPEVRSQQLLSAISEIFNDPLNRSYLATEVVQKLANIDRTKERDGIAYWVTFGDWPKAPDAYNPGFPTVSYINRYGYQDNLRRANESEHIYHSIIMATTADEAEAIIKSYWNNAYDESRQRPGAVPELGVPGVGLKLPMTDLLMLGGPVLLFFQVIFVILWDRIHLQTGNEPVELPFVFPSYACPRDPLRAPSPKGLSEYAQRFVWLLFLILPLLILSFGFLTRYDATMILVSVGRLLNWRDVSWAGREWDADMFSLFLDILTLACLGLSLMIIARICSHDIRENIEHEPHSVLWRLTRYLPCFIWIVVGLVKIDWLAHKGTNMVGVGMLGTVALEMLVVMAFCTVWSVMSWVAAKRSARLIIVSSVCVAILFAILPVLHPFFE